MSPQGQIQPEEHHGGTRNTPQPPPHALERSRQIPFFKNELQTRSFVALCINSSTARRETRLPNLAQKPGNHPRATSCAQAALAEGLAVTKKILSMPSALLWKPQLHRQSQNSLSDLRSSRQLPALGLLLALVVPSPWHCLLHRELTKSFGLLEDEEGGM